VLLSKRKQAIMNLLYEKRSMSFRELIKHFDVAPATMRRDITSLEKAGMLLRTRGEVHYSSRNGSGMEEAIPSFFVRNELNVTDKEKIARKAASLISDGMTIIFDSGSTTTAIANKITDKVVTVVTNSLDIVYELLQSKAQVISCGGMLMAKDMCFLGPDAEHFISKIEVDILFLGATGVRNLEGLTTSSPLHYNIKKTMIKAAKKRCAVFDLSKFSSANLFVFSDLTDLDMIITTRPPAGSPEEEKINRIRDLGVEVLLADD